MEIDAIPSGFRVRRRHLIGEHRIDVAVSPDLARPALLDRIGELNRSRFLPLIERLFDEVDRPGELIRIDRLSIDLGRFDGDDLEGVEARLAEALRRALGEALGNARRRPAGAIGRGDGAERVGLGVALVEAFEHYLLHGAWPYGAGMDPGARPAACLAQLIAEEPAALVAMLRRRGPADPLLRRLVRQMPEAELRALLHRLEPAHAAYVLSYLDEVRASHEVEPVVPATREELDETLWTIVLRDALQKAGLQANRKAFLRRLLAQLEAAHGVPAGSLVLQLRRGLKGVRGRRREPGSLVEILAELIAEDVGLIARPLLMAELAALLGSTGPADADGRAELREMLGLALRGHRTELGWLLRRLAEEDEPKLAARLAPALPPDVTLDQLLDTGPAPRGRSRRGRATSDAPLAALARLLDLPAAATTAGSREDMRLLMRLLDEAGAGDALALRALLRDFAVADAGRLRRRVAAALPASALAALLLPPHLAAPLIALAEAAECTPEEWDMMLRIAGEARETGFPEMLAGRALAGLAAARGLTPLKLGVSLALDSRRGRARADAARLVRLYSALDRAAILWSASTPFSSVERAEALGRLLPSLTGLPPSALRQRLRAAGAGRSPDLAAMAPSRMLRLALLLAPPGAARDAVRAQLRGTGPEAQILVIRSLIETGELPAAPPQPKAPPPGVPARARAALAQMLQRLSPAALDRLIAALAAAAASPPDTALAGLPRWQVALSLALQGGEGAAEETIAVADRTGDGDLALALLRVRLGEGADRPLWVARALAGLSGRELGDLLDILAPAATARGRAVRRRLRVAPGDAALRGQVAALIAGADLVTPRLPAGAPTALGAKTSKARRRIALAALLRTRPLEAIRRAAASDSGALAEALPDLLAEPAAPALLFAALAPAERERAVALGRLLTGRAGRSAIAPEKVARALALAAGAREWRGGAEGFAGAWLDALIKMASLTEQAALKRLLGERWREAVPSAKADARDVPGEGAGRDREAGLAREEAARGMAGEGAGRGGKARLAQETAARGLSGEGAERGETGPLREAGDGAFVADAPGRGLARRLSTERAISRHAVADPRGAIAALRAVLRDRRKRAALVAGLAEGELIALLVRIAPTSAAALLHAAERLAAARRAAGAGIDRASMWRALLAAAIRDPGDVARLVALLLDGGEDVPAPPATARARAEQGLAAALEGGRDAPLRAALDLRARARRRAAAAAEPARPTLEEDDDGAIHIANAGLVLTSAFLPHLFRTLDFIAIEPSGRQGWKSPELRDRAVHLLQWLVDERCDAPEPQLALNKLLCGMHPLEPVVAEIIPTKEERDALGQLLAAILANWPPLQSSSAAALRETYLQREGRLAPGDNGWTLEVERKVLDILIDQLPWGFSTILHPWMTEVVNVSWGSG